MLRGAGDWYRSSCALVSLTENEPDRAVRWIDSLVNSSTVFENGVGSGAISGGSPNMAVNVNKTTLEKNEFTKGAGNAWYYGTERNHIHLITSGATVIRVTAVSIKIDDRGLGNLPELPSGKFDVTYRADRWGTWRINFQQALLRIGVGGE
jgi:hypothetical protein